MANGGRKKVKVAGDEKATRRQLAKQKAERADSLEACMDYIEK